MDWRDLRMALAIGQHGRLSHAARALGVDPTTVSRRVTTLEQELGCTLFRRTPRRWTATPAGQVLLARCDAIATEVRTLKHQLDAVEERVSGRVRITAVDAVLSSWLVPALPQLQRDHPGLQLELFASNVSVDLNRGRADVAVRLGRPEQAGLIARRMANVGLVLAARAELLERPVEERPVALVGFLDTDSPENRRLRSLGGPVVFAATSLTVSNALVRGGQAIGVLTERMARSEGLVIVDDRIPSREVWRAVPEALADAPRIRAVTDWLDGVFT